MMQPRFVSRLIGRVNIYRSLSHLQIIMRDSHGAPASVHSDEEHLQATMEWLCRAQDVTACGGVSAKYDFRAGWMPPYPETTGYIFGKREGRI